MRYYYINRTRKIQYAKKKKKKKITGAGYLTEKQNVAKYLNQRKENRKQLE
jgi:hypothetical protein